MRTRRFRHARRPIDPACPSWCDRDHLVDVDVEDMVLHVRSFGLGVELVAVDDLDARTRTAPEVTVAATSAAANPDARALALAILAAGDFLEDGAR